MALSLTRLYLQVIEGHLLEDDVATNEYNVSCSDKADLGGKLEGLQVILLRILSSAKGQEAR